MHELGSLLISSTSRPTDETIAGALLGAAVTALVTLLVFIIDRIIRTVSDFRESRRALFSDIMTAFGAFVAAAHVQNAFPAGTEGVDLVSARSRMMLSLGTRHRVVGVWLAGMEVQLSDSARLVTQTLETRKERAVFLDTYVGRVFNALIDLQQRRLFVNDFVLPAEIFELARLDPTYSDDHHDELEWASRPRSAGRWDATKQFVRSLRRGLWKWARTWAPAEGARFRPPAPQDRETVAVQQDQ
jgi:hypothetical protein